MAEPQPLIFHFKVTVPQNTVADQNAGVTGAQLAADMQTGGLDADATLPAGTTVELVDHQQ